MPFVVMASTGIAERLACPSPRLFSRRIKLFPTEGNMLVRYFIDVLGFFRSVALKRKDPVANAEEIIGSFVLEDTT